MTFKYKFIPVRKPRRKARGLSDTTLDEQETSECLDDIGFEVVKSITKSSPKEKNMEQLMKIIDDKISTLATWNSCTDFSDRIKDKLAAPESQNSIDIVCYGIGSIADSILSQWQLALILVLSRRIKKIRDMVYYDPVLLSEIESNVLVFFGFKILDVNEEGRRKIDKPTLFYMPHCPLALYDNVLNANWNASSLRHLYIFGNLLTNYYENMSDSKLAAKAPHVLEVSKVGVDALDFPTLEDCPRAFNDTSFQQVRRSEELSGIAISAGLRADDTELIHVENDATVDIKCKTR
ncbi:sensitivity to red-light reduced protein, variant 2 [Entomophthora muscae]|uniref:Sensitivity to red-light reduced protein, variant 2 n=1 Tax=Entomophthora muscae TaxID=34485 RepID=A0ACC2TEW4_9FUNG|nr:sensitivity to red-light reduced protein, variant 2 [Entomophthora muscae]